MPSKFASVVSAAISNDTAGLKEIIERRADFTALKKMPGYAEASNVVRDVFRDLGLSVLDNPEKIEYLKGLRDGLQMFFLLVEEAAEEASDAANYLQALSDPELSTEVLS